jgi:hypothetical protein
VHHSEIKLGQPLTIITQIFPFQSDEFGEYKTVLHLGTGKYERAIVIQRAPRPA